MKTSLWALCSALFCGTLCADVEEVLVDMSAGDQTVNVGEGQTKRLVITSPGADYSITKTGAGTLCLTNNNFSASYSNLVVQGGLVQVDAENNFGGGTVTLTDGGGLRIAKSFTHSLVRVIKIESGSFGVIDIPSGVTFTVNGNYFITAGASLAKTGAGTFATTVNGSFQSASTGNAYWILEEGVLLVNVMSTFVSGSASVPSLTIEIREDAALQFTTPIWDQAFGNLILRGGTLRDVDIPRLEGTNIYAPYCNRYAWLNGKITVIPSLNGKPALIEGSYFVPCNANANSKTTVLDVQEGATLNFNCRLLRSSNSICKKGAGTLNIFKPLWTTGTFDIQEGIVNFVGNGVHFEPTMNLAVADGAVLRLGTNTVYDVVAKTNTSVVLDVPDGVSACIGGVVGSISNLYQTLVKTGEGSLAFAATNNTDSGLRIEAGALRFPSRWPSQAAIWLDASDVGTLTTNDEGYVCSVTNKGYAGGLFVPYAEEVTAHPTVETINYLPALRFDGNDVLRLTSFTNTPPREMVIMIVKERDAFTANCGPFSFGVATSAGNDGDSGTGLVSYDKETAKITLDAGNTSRDLTVDSTDGITVVEVYHVLYNNVFFAQLIATTDPSAVTRMDCLYGSFSTADLNTPINLWQLGGRLASGGVPRLMWNGRIGEVMVFPQPLSTAQATAAIDYLRQKWMNVGSGATNAPLFLAGYSPQVGGLLDVELTDGTALRHDTGTLALKSLSVTGSVDWVRTGPTSSALFTIADDLAFNAAAVTLALDPFPEESTVLMTYGGSFAGAGPAWTLLGEGADFAKVRHNTVGKSIILSIQSGSVFMIK